MKNKESIGSITASADELIALIHQFKSKESPPSSNQKNRLKRRNTIICPSQKEKSFMTLENNSIADQIQSFQDPAAASFIEDPDTSPSELILEKEEKLEKLRKKFASLLTISGNQIYFINFRGLGCQFQTSRGRVRGSSYFKLDLRQKFARCSTEAYQNEKTIRKAIRKFPFF